jgi:hypothetical protein
MGLVDDILQGLPVNSLLRGQVSQLNAQKAAVDEQNAILADDNRELKAEIAKLNQQIEKLTHKDDLTEIEREALKLIARLDESYSTALSGMLGLPQAKADYYFQRLSDAGYIGAVGFGGEPLYFLEQKGRAYLVENDLI